MRNFGLTLLTAILLPVAGHTQGGGLDMAGALAKQGLSSAEEMARSAPDTFRELIDTKTKAFDTEPECMTELQLLTSSAAAVSQVMPFSKVWTDTLDDNDPILFFKVMVTGEKISGVLACVDNVLRYEKLDWDQEVPDTATVYAPDLLNAGLAVWWLSTDLKKSEKEAQASKDTSEETGQEDAGETTGSASTEANTAEQDKAAAEYREEHNSDVMVDIIKADPALDVMNHRSILEGVTKAWIEGYVPQSALEEGVEISFEFENGSLKPHSVQLVTGKKEILYEVARRAIIRGLAHHEVIGYMPGTYKIVMRFKSSING